MKSGKWAKIARSIAGLTLAAGLAMLTAGCKGVDIYIVPKDPDASQTEPNKDLTDPEQKDPETPTTPTQPSTPTEPDYSEYSQLLQDILKSDYYNDLIVKYEAGQLNRGSIDAHDGSIDAVPNIMDALPFNFLEKAGEDVKEIKINNIQAGSYAYVKTENKNELYSCIIITKNYSSNENFITIYLLKYNITIEEYKDFSLLSALEYYQACFFIQELDKTREAELVNKFSISQKNYEGLIKYINNNNRKEEDPLKLKLGEKEISDFFLKPNTIEFENLTANEKDMYIDIEFVTVGRIYNKNKPSSERELGSARILFNWGEYPSCVDDFIHLNSSVYSKVVQIYNTEPIRKFEYYAREDFIKKQKNFV